MSLSFHSPERLRLHEILQAAWRAELGHINPIVRVLQNARASFSDSCNDIYLAIQPIIDGAATNRLLLGQFRDAIEAAKSCPICHGVGARCSVGTTDYTRSTYAEPYLCGCIKAILELAQPTVPS